VVRLGVCAATVAAVNAKTTANSSATDADAFNVFMGIPPNRFPCLFHDRGRFFLKAYFPVVRIGLNLLPSVSTQTKSGALSKSLGIDEEVLRKF